MPQIFRRKSGVWGIRHRENPFRELAYHRTKKEYRDTCDEHAYFIIGFCGKLYVGWKLYHIIDRYDEVSTEIIYDLEYIKSILEEKSWHGNLEDSLNYVQSYDAINIFRELNALVFVFDSNYNRTFIIDNTYNNYHPNLSSIPHLKIMNLVGNLMQYKRFKKFRCSWAVYLVKEKKKLLKLLINIRLRNTDLINEVLEKNHKINDMKIIDEIKQDISAALYDGHIVNLSDIGNEIGIVIGKYSNDNVEDFIGGVKHRVSLSNGTHP